MRAVNLLPREAVVAERPSLTTQLPVIGAALVPLIAAGLLIVGYESAHTLVGSRSAELANLEAALPATIPAAAAAAAPQLSILNASIGARQAALESALGQQIPWDTTLDDIARVIPTGVWLTSLSATSPNSASAAAAAAAAAAPATTTTDTTAASTTTTAASTPAPAPSASPSGFSIAGDAYTEQDLAALLSRLELMPALGDVTLGSATSSKIGTKTVVQFTITANIEPPAAGAQP